MSNALPKSLMSDCCFDDQVPWTGVRRLVGIREPQLFSILAERPGVQPYTESRLAPAGWHVPLNLIEAGQRPATLADWPPVSHRYTPSGLELFEHQARAANFLLDAIGPREGCILGAQAGLGKSITALQALWLSGLLQKPGIVCAPSQAAKVWCSATGDAGRHYGVQFKQLEGVKDPDVALLLGTRHVFVNYDILPAWWGYLCTALKPSFVIFDEIHLLMHRQTRRAEAAFNLANWATLQVRYGLTGTPVPNRRCDIWHQLHIVQPHQWSKTLHKFGMVYADGRIEGDEHHTHHVYDGESNNEELQARLAGVLLRYNKRSVTGNLPQLTRRFVPAQLPAEAMEEYRDAARDIRRYLIEHKGAQVGKREIQIGDEIIEIKDKRIAALQIQGVTALINLLSKHKAYTGIAVAREMLQRHQKLLVLLWRRESARVIADALKGIDGLTVIGPLSGQISQAKREALATQFATTAGSAVCVATLKSVGISMNALKAASAALFVDLYWNTAVLLQGEGRIDREGNPNAKIEIAYLIAEGTLDDRILELLKQKATAATGVSEHDDQGTQLVSALRPEGPTNNKSIMQELCRSLQQMDMDDWNTE